MNLLETLVGDCVHSPCRGRKTSRNGVSNRTLISCRNLLETLVGDFALIPRDGVAQPRVVPRVDDGAAELAEPRLARHYQQRRVEQRMVLAQVFLALVPDGPEIFTQRLSEMQPFKE